MTALIQEDENLKRIRHELWRAEAVVIGAGSGLSSAAGLTYGGERFQKYFGDFINTYHMTDMYSAGFYPFPTQEEKWAYWSRHIYYNRYDQPEREAYLDLYRIVKDKNYFVLTTNVDHQFWLAGFEDHKIFATQGDYGLFQCSKACHKKLYDNEAQIRKMVAMQKDLKIPSTLVPLCPVCGQVMEVNLRSDQYFVEDEAWYGSAGRYEAFLKSNSEKRTVFLELGVGLNTPSIIKYPFWEMTAKWKHGFYICVNKGQAWAPQKLQKKSICLDMDLALALKALSKGEPPAL